jgi:aryl carrier-like protein
MNSYGPSECCVDVSCSKPILQPRDAHTVGFPLDVNFWVTNPSNYNRLVPIGIPGELLVEGPLLARGYLHDLEKTSKAFVWDPNFVTQLGLSPGRRMYRTGDLVQQKRDGSLIHLGRIDAQIKIRGQRVETGEVESNIVRLEEHVRNACVDLVRPKDVSGDSMLMAAIDVGDFGRDTNDNQDNLQEQTVRQPTNDLRAMIQSLRSKLLLVLPRYMIPHFVPMTSLPVNASSKLDRKATRTILAGLNREEIVIFERTTDSNGGTVLSPMEDQLREIWVEVLGCSPKIGPDDHFVQLGGDSVTAMRLVAVARRLDIRIGVADIVQNPRLSDLARVAENYNFTRAVNEDPVAFELWHGFTTGDAEIQKVWLTTIAERCGLAPQDIEDVYPSTPLQEGLMAMTAQQPGAYVAQNVFRIQGADVTRLKEAWAKVVCSLAILRTRIVYHDASSGSVQVVVRKPLEWNEEQDLQTYLAKDLSLPFAYGTPLHRLAIIQPAGNQADNEKYFVWTQHHSGYDGYQNAMMLKILAHVYQHGGEYDHSTAPIPRFIKFLQQTDEAKKISATYWRRELGDASLMRFPPLPNPAYRPHAADVLHSHLQVDKAAVVPIPILLRAAWAATVATYTGSQEAVLNVALSGRDIPVTDIANMIAPTITTVPVRIRLAHDQMVSDLLAAVELQSKEMVPHIHTGLQNIRKALGTGFDFEAGHLFVVQPAFAEDTLENIGLEEAIVVNNADFGGYALTVQCTVDSKARDVDLEMRFDDKVLAKPRARAVLTQFEHFIQLLSTHSRPGSLSRSIGELDLLSPADAITLRRQNQQVPDA